MPAMEQLAPNVSREESIQGFRPSHHKDNRRLIPVLLDLTPILKNPRKFSLYQFLKGPLDNTTAGTVLLAKHNQM